MYHHHQARHFIELKKKQHVTVYNMTTLRIGEKFTDFTALIISAKL